jgi:hypothetical protein
MAAVADTGSTAAWFTLAGALGGVLVTSAVALTTAVLNHRWQTHSVQQQLLQEHLERLRQERRETYARYWSTWNRYNHQLRALRTAAQKLGPSADPSTDPKDRLTQEAPSLVEQAWTAELEWREAADALLLIAGQAVVEAAQVHIETMEHRRNAAWEGAWYHDEGGRAYRGLNDAMRTELLQPAKP